MAKHPGFAAVQKKIEGEGHSKESAGAILASASRHASAKAKKANPNLKKVKGMAGGGSVSARADGCVERGKTKGEWV
jgi:hypothetical protein